MRSGMRVFWKERIFQQEYKKQCKTTFWNFQRKWISRNFSKAQKSHSFRIKRNIIPTTIYNIWKADVSASPALCFWVSLPTSMRSSRSAVCALCMLELGRSLVGLSWDAPAAVALDHPQLDSYHEAELIASRLNALHGASDNERTRGCSPPSKEQQHEVGTVAVGEHSD